MEHFPEDGGPVGGRLGGGVFEGQAGTFFRAVGDYGAVVGDNHADGFFAAGAATDSLVVYLCVAPFVLVQVLQGVAVSELLDVEVLVVGGGVGYAPADPGVVPEVGEGRNAGEGQSDDVELGAGDAVLVVGVGGVKGAMGVAGQDGLAGGGAATGAVRFPSGSAGDHPTVAAAIHFRQVIEGGCALGQFLEASVQYAP